MNRLWFIYIAVFLAAWGCQRDQTTSPISIQPVGQSANIAEATLVSKASLTKLSFSQQQRLWEGWLADTRVAVEADPTAENRKILKFIEENAVQVDSTLGAPAKLAGTKFNVLIMDQDLDVSIRKSLGNGDGVFASYNENYSSLILRSGEVPRKVRGTIGFHEGVHAYHYRNGLIPDLETPKGHWMEELGAYAPQLRQFRALYRPGYEKFRRSLVKMLDDDIRRRLSAPGKLSDREAFEATMPNIMLLGRVIGDPAEAKKAFGLSDSVPVDQLMIYLNFAFLDAGFECLERGFPKDDWNNMKALFLSYTAERAGL